jgi:hypothetical protein
MYIIQCIYRAGRCSQHKGRNPGPVYIKIVLNLFQETKCFAPFTFGKRLKGKWKSDMIEEGD